MLDDLARLPAGVEIIFVSPDPELSSYKAHLTHTNTRWILSESGRAGSMNQGAKMAKGEYVWFLHADSKFAKDSIAGLFATIKKYPKSLLFFDLAFYDGIKLMYLNSLGAKFRSNILKTPFGDQGLCLKKDLFYTLGAFDEDLEYGEDHLLVIRARQHGVKIQPIGAKLYTSARKYIQNGWLKTTLLYQYLWIKQSWKNRRNG